MSAMPTEKYPGVLEFVLLYSLSPSQFCMLNTTDALSGNICVSHGYPLSLPAYLSNRGLVALDQQAWCLP